MYLIVGLGNPGREYEKTRHNVGFEVIDCLSGKLGIDVKKIKFKGLYGEGFFKGDKVILLKPSTYMNLSGESLREAMDFYKVPLNNLIVIYDDADIDVGRIRIRPSGSSGGHNGMKSIIYNLNNDEFARIRVGIGGPEDADMVSYVLGRFKDDEKKLLDGAIRAAGEAVIEIMENGVTTAMNKYNSFKETID